jgi:hypothetical protein
MPDHTADPDEGTPPTPVADDAGDDAEDDPLPADAVAEAERLTRLAREAVDDGERTAYREDRAALLDDHDYVARVREADDTLVLYPQEWVTDGTVYPEDIEDVDRGVEVSLSGPGDPEEWDDVEEHNTAVVERVRETGGDVHAQNVRAFADFMGNHYARHVETASSDEIAEFVGEYFPRNAWPSATQREKIEESIDLVFEVTDREPPAFRRALR